MVRTIYFLLLIYFTLGAISFYFINRRKKKEESRQSWIKLTSYFIIINILFFSIVINPVVFRYVAVIIIARSFFELFKLFRQSGYRNKGFFIISVSVLTVMTIGFYIFSGMDMGVILFTFLVLSIFDGFSQITGQLWGRRKLSPSISPRKTVEGLIGGFLVASLSAILLENLLSVSPPKALRLGAGVALFAFAGDMSSSYYKRKYGVKDFCNLIPGHGGFLDRFDSLIACGAWVALNGILMELTGNH
jgi:phosphatidate cytidylyltransferase